MLGFGSHAVLTGAMQIGDLVAFLMLTAFLYDPVSRLHQLNQLVQAGRAAGERVFEILDEQVEAGAVAGPVIPAPRSPIAATRLAFWATSATRCKLQLRRRIASAQARFLSCAAGRDCRAGRSNRRRQIDPGESARALLRIHERRNLYRWKASP